MAQFIANEKPFAVRVAPDLKVEIGTDKPVEVGVHSYKVSCTVTDANGLPVTHEIDKKIDVADRLRKSYGKYVTEVKDGETPKRDDDKKADSKRGR